VSIPDQFPRPIYRPVPAVAAPADGTAGDSTAGEPGDTRAAPGSWPWRRAALLVTGMIGQVTHTGVFFLPALAAMTVAALRLWREGA